MCNKVNRKRRSVTVVTDYCPTCTRPHDAVQKQHATVFRPTVAHEKPGLMSALISWLTHNPNRPFRIRVNYTCAF